MSFVLADHPTVWLFLRWEGQKQEHANLIKNSGALGRFDRVAQ